jgi:hypothetical protein
MSAMQAVMRIQAPTAARSLERSHAVFPVRALTTAATAPTSARANPATVAA